jgi:hypothetical protein
VRGAPLGLDCGMGRQKWGVENPNPYVYILVMVVGWAWFTKAVELEWLYRLMIYRGGCVRMPASVNIY